VVDLRFVAAKVAPRLRRRRGERKSNPLTQTWERQFEAVATALMRRPRSGVATSCPAHVGTGASVDLDGFALFDKERHVDCFPGIDVADDRLDECAQISGRTVMDFEHNGRVAVVLNCHSFAKIVCRGHERKVKSLKRSAEVTRAQSNFKRVRSCESTMPTGTL